MINMNNSDNFQRLPDDLSGADQYFAIQADKPQSIQT